MYTLDADSARQADQRGGRITETGKYVGTFVKAEDITTPKGTKGIDFAFKSSNGQTCRFAIYTTKGDGSRINIGHSFVMALLTCLQLRGIQPKAGRFKEWDYDTSAEVEKTGQLFPDLQNKPIGILLEQEEYQKNDGGVGKRVVLAGVFQASTELTASEILDRKTQPAQLGKMVASLRDRKAKPQGAAASPAPAAHSSHQQSTNSAQPTRFDDMDDDIPF